jgi:hypothetical protein
VFSEPVGPNQGFLDNQSKNTQSYIAFSVQIFSLKVEIACGKKLKLDVATSP